MESTMRSSAVVAAVLLLGILINGQFPGPKINCTSNNNIVVNVFNNLDEPFLLTWYGIQQRKNSWQDGTPGTMCPIMPGTNFTYRFQVKDQIGSYYYFPTTGLHKASGGIGALQVHSRLLIPVPFDQPADEFAILMGDWYTKGHKYLKKLLDSGRSLGRPDGIQINGKSSKVGDNDQPLVTMEAGKTYRYRVCNVGLKTSLNFRIQGHTLKLVELEGSHTVQNVYDSLDVHVGQCMSVLVTANQEPKDYYMVASSRFTRKRLLALATIRYANGKGPASTELPAPPPETAAGIAWSDQPVSVVPLEPHSQRRQTQPSGILPLRTDQHHPHHQARQLQGPKYYGAEDKVFKYDTIKDAPEAGAKPQGSGAQTRGRTTTWWMPLAGTAFRCTRDRGPAIMTTLDNAGMWNLRSEMWENAYLGQQLYVSILSPARSLRDEYNLPDNTQLCGIVKDLPKPPPYSI
ncbi:SKU5 similar 13 [Actinidia rufa]|uniref:SKU5 similar 13 n=1 Tax=Actinidia rufa TaxID=165716 RepID=A0A7J0GPY4_9ERIC|nr:SKU5 similar 13 [Actinidia rufa]